MMELDVNYRICGQELRQGLIGLLYHKHYYPLLHHLPNPLKLKIHYIESMISYWNYLFSNFTNYIMPHFTCTSFQSVINYGQNWLSHRTVFQNQFIRMRKLFWVSCFYFRFGGERLVPGSRNCLIESSNYQTQ